MTSEMTDEQRKERRERERERRVRWREKMQRAEKQSRVLPACLSVSQSVSEYSVCVEWREERKVKGKGEGERKREG